MARGFLSGALWGVVVAGGSAAGLSLAYPDFKPGQSAMQMETSAETETETTGADTAALESDAAPSTDMTTDSSDTDSSEDVGEDVLVTESAGMEDAPAGDTADPEAADEMPAEVMVVPPEDTMTETAMAEEQPTTSTDDSAAMMSEDAAAEPTEIMQAETDQDITVSDRPDTETTATQPSAMPALAARIAELQNEQAAEENTEEPSGAMTDSEGSEEVEVAAMEAPKPEVPSQSDRLPSISDNEEPAAKAPRPFDTYSANFEVDGEKPLMTIVLLDDQNGTLGPETLETFPYPLTFAVDASQPGAAERMKLYREKGFEVLALINLPRGAAPSDVEVAMAAYLAAVPEAVGVIEGTETGVQTSRDVTDQLTQILIESGHGLLLQASGLNTAQKLAAREGVPSGTVFRDFDGNGQTASVMRRFLDQAAFRAGQEGGVVMMGRLQAETISALLIWGLADRASRVSLVPVTTLLKTKQAQ